MDYTIKYYYTQISHSTVEHITNVADTIISFVDKDTGIGDGTVRGFL